MNEKQNLYPYVHYNFNNYMSNGIQLKGSKQAELPKYAGMKPVGNFSSSMQSKLSIITDKINLLLKNFNVDKKQKIGKVEIINEKEIENIYSEILRRIGEVFPAIIDKIVISNGVIINKDEIKTLLEETKQERESILGKDIKQVGKNQKELKSIIENVISGLNGLLQNGSNIINERKLSLISGDIQELENLSKRLEKTLPKDKLKGVKDDYKMLMEAVSLKYWGNASWEILIGLLGELIVEYGAQLGLAADAAANGLVVDILGRNAGTESKKGLETRAKRLTNSFDAMGVDEEYASGIKAHLNVDFNRSTNNRSKVDVQVMMDVSGGESEKFNFSVKNTYTDKMSHQLSLVQSTPYFDLLSDDIPFMYHTFNIYAVQRGPKAETNQKAYLRNFRTILRTSLAYKALIGLDTSQLTNTFAVINSNSVEGFKQEAGVAIVSTEQILQYLNEKIQSADEMTNAIIWDNLSVKGIGTNPIWRNEWIKGMDTMAAASERSGSFLVQAHKKKIDIGINLYGLMGAMSQEGVIMK